MANKCYVYCKFKDDNKFRAYSLEYGPLPAGSRAYATMMVDNERAHAKQAIEILGEDTIKRALGVI